MPMIISISPFYRRKSIFRMSWIQILEGKILFQRHQKIEQTKVKAQNYGKLRVEQINLFQKHWRSCQLRVKFGGIIYQKVLLNAKVGSL